LAPKPHFRLLRLTGDWPPPARPRQWGLEVHNDISLLDAIDRLCGEFAAAMHNAEWQIYATLALVIVLSALLFPPKNDRDQI
jgi:hypothetical protein